MSNIRSFTALYFVLSLGLSLSSCTTVLKEVVKEPKMSIQDVSLQKVTLQEVAMEVAMTVTNPNAFTVDLAGIDYQVQALGMTLGQGETNQALVLAPNKPLQIKLPLRLKPEAALKFAQAYLSRSQDVVATVQTTVRVNSPVGPLSLQFSEDQKVR